MASSDGFHVGSVAMNVSRLNERATTRGRANSHQRASCGHSNLALTVISISMILLGVIVIVFGTLCASAGVRYGVTGDTLIKPWRAMPLGILAVVCGGLGVRLSRTIKSKPRKQAIVTVLLSVVCSAWAVVVILSYSFDVSEQSHTYKDLKEEFKEATASRGVLFTFRENKMNLALRDVVYFSGAVAFSSMSCIVAAVLAVMSGLIIRDPGGNEQITQGRRTHPGRGRNIITSVTKVFVNYKNRAALVTGIIQIVCGCSVVLGLGLALATEHNPAWAAYVISHGIFFIATGITGAVSCASKTKRIVTASTIISLCAAVAAFNMICSDVAFIINSNIHPTSGRSKIDKFALSTKLFAIHGLDLFVNLIQLVSAAILSGLGCHVICDVAGKADDARCLVSYVEVGQMDRSDRTDYNMNDPENAFSLQIPDILHSSMTTEDDLFGKERPQYMTDALAGTT